MPLTIFDNNGVPVWDTDSVAGGIIAGIYEYPSNASGTLLFPSFDGRTAYILPVNQWNWPTPIGVSIDYAPGYPRVIVSSPVIATRRFAVLIV